MIVHLRSVVSVLPDREWLVSQLLGTESLIRNTVCNWSLVFKLEQEKTRPFEILVGTWKLLQKRASKVEVYYRSLKINLTMNIRKDEPLKFRYKVYRKNKHKVIINSAWETCYLAIWEAKSIPALCPTPPH